MGGIRCARRGAARRPVGLERRGSRPTARRCPCTPGRGDARTARGRRLGGSAGGVIQHLLRARGDRCVRIPPPHRIGARGRGQERRPGPPGDALGPRSEGPPRRSDRRRPRLGCDERPAPAGDPRRPTPSGARLSSRWHELLLEPLPNVRVVSRCQELTRSRGPHRTTQGPHRTTQGRCRPRASLDGGQTSLNSPSTASSPSVPGSDGPLPSADGPAPSPVPLSPEGPASAELAEAW